VQTHPTAETAQQCEPACTPPPHAEAVKLIYLIFSRKKITLLFK